MYSEYIECVVIKFDAQNVIDAIKKKSIVGWFISQASGDHLPTPHPLPDAIASSIEYNLKQADKQYLQEAYAEQGY